MSQEKMVLCSEAHTWDSLPHMIVGYIFEVGESVKWNDHAGRLCMEYLPHNGE